MFDHFLVSVVVVPPVLLVLVRLLADRLSPRVAAPVVAWSAAGAAVASLINLLVFALKAVAELPPVARWFGWSVQLVVNDTAHYPWVSWTSVVLLTAAAVSTAVTWQRQRRLLALATAGTAEAGALVVVPDPAPHAFAVPGRPGHVVVTTGMRDALSPAQFVALLAHERAHLAARHHRLIRVAELAAAAHPALWWVSRHVDYLVERAADERAATEVGSRRTVAQAIGAAALAAAAPMAPAGLHAAAPGGVVPRRVASLLNPRARVAAVVGAVPVALALFSMVWTVEAAWDLGELITAALGQG
ncbi:M56 family metallopeptidase [Actinoplanes xinjiangensis]|uniref:Peptidase M48-like protein n=1 Tax=Actinoplanes xinjiangensis TaxID=512350 RepID=A0A316FE46_9ACTN|nr:M56 family metallopeptidase [Actinoplanes xinjiangensis]PWK47171.1 peptidase M48-like protein [Actinoplanes xinjiangensis]GIF40331.1 peptidase M48 [Actinoplanes xinjiangensis]